MIFFELNHDENSPIFMENIQNLSMLSHFFFLRPDCRAPYAYFLVTFVTNFFKGSQEKSYFFNLLYKTFYAHATTLTLNLVLRFLGIILFHCDWTRICALCYLSHRSSRSASRSLKCVTSKNEDFHSERENNEIFWKFKQMSQKVAFVGWTRLRIRKLYTTFCALRQSEEYHLFWPFLWWERMSKHLIVMFDHHRSPRLGHTQLFAAMECYSLRRRSGL